MTIGAALVAALGLSAGAATAATAAKPSSYCVREAGWITDSTLNVLHHYDHDVYPADVSLIQLNTSIKQFKLHHCPSAPLRADLLQRLTQKQRTRLFEILPTVLVRWFRGVLAAQG
jgi:hypothetical protein